MVNAFYNLSIKTKLATVLALLIFPLLTTNILLIRGVDVSLMTVLMIAFIALAMSALVFSSILKSLHQVVWAVEEKLHEKPHQDELGAVAQLMSEKLMALNAKVSHLERENTLSKNEL